MLRRKLADSSQPFGIMADLNALPGRGDEVATAIAGSQVIPLTRLEAGCIAYDLYRDTDAPDCFVMHERWSNLDALAVHLATAHFNAAGAALAGLLAKTPTVRVLTPAGEQP